MILIAFLVGINCSLVGGFLLIRKQVMIGDAISHAVLPGIVLSFLLSGSLHPVMLLGGAIIAGIVAVLLINFFNKKVQTGSEEAIGFVFTSFFAVGLLLSSLYANKADLDVECVLYGNLVMAPLNVWIWRGVVLGPKAVYLLLGLLIFNLVVISIFYKRLLLMSFDENYAKILGCKVFVWDYVLMVLVAITLTLVFKFVGGVLAIAFLVIPTATGYLLTVQLSRLLFLAYATVFCMAWGGYKLAFITNGSVVGSMVTIGGGLFVLAFIQAKYKKKSKAIMS